MKNASIYFLGLLLLLTATQCRKESHAPVVVNNTVNTPVDSTKTFLALGDSYTIGQSVSISERFPEQTAALLRAMGIKVTYPQYIAATGWTTENLSTAITSQDPAGPFSVVTLLIGVNDQYQRHDTIGYRNRFRGLLHKSIDLAGSKRDHVFVLSIPDYSVTPFAMNYDTAFIRKQIDLFNKINKQVTAEEFCQYLDITPSTREAATDPTLIAFDGLHPSGIEYAKWANRLAPMMSQVLQ